MLILSRKLIGKRRALSLVFPQSRVFAVCQDFQKIYCYLWNHPAVLWLHCVTYSLGLETKAWVQSLPKPVRIFPLTPVAPELGFCDDKKHSREMEIGDTNTYVSVLKTLYQMIWKSFCHLGSKTISFQHQFLVLPCSRGVVSPCPGTKLFFPHRLVCLGMHKLFL